MNARQEVAVAFGENLARERKRRGLTQERLAALASLHRTEIGMLEKGKRSPRIDTLVRLGSSLDVDLGPLLSGISWHVGGFAQRGSFDFGPDKPSGRQGNKPS